jgi:hypothetical protein
MINDLSQGKELLQEFRDEPNLAADEVFIKMMKKLNFYILEEPYFYHGPGSNLKSKRTNVCLSQVEKEWGPAVRLQFEPTHTLDDELDNWRNPVVKKGGADELINQAPLFSLAPTEQVVQPELPNFTHSLGENDEDS